MFNIALFGAGRIGYVHAKTIFSHSRLNLYSITDVNLKSAEKLALDFNTKVLSEEEVFLDKKVDGFLIASSTNTHFHLLKKASSTKKKVFCEKPIDLNLENAKKVVEIIQKDNSKVMMGFNRRFDKNFHTLRNSLIKGEIGSVEQIIITSRDPAPPPIEYVKVSGGLFKDMSIHDIDMACFLMNDRPRKVTARGSALVDKTLEEINHIDIATLILEFEHGKQVIINNNRRAVYGYDQRIEVIGSKGMLQAENILENTVIKSTSQSIESKKPLYFFLERYTQAYESILDEFVEVLKDEKEPSPNEKDGLLALQIAEIADKSLKSNKTEILENFI